MRTFETGASLGALVTDGHTSLKYMQIFNVFFNKMYGIIDVADNAHTTLCGTQKNSLRNLFYMLTVTDEATCKILVLT